MRRRNLSDRDLERLLSGSVEPDDAPPGYERVAELLSAARAAGRYQSGAEARAVPGRPARRRGRRVATIAVLVVAATSPLVGFDTLPSAAAGLSGYVVREFIADDSSSGSGDAPAAPESSSSQPEHGGASQGSTGRDEEPSTPLTFSPQAEGEPPAQASSSSHGQSKGADPKEPGEPGRSGRGADGGGPPPHKSDGGSGPGAPSANATNPRGPG